MYTKLARSYRVAAKHSLFGKIEHWTQTSEKEEEQLARATPLQLAGSNPILVTKAKQFCSRAAASDREGCVLDFVANQGLVT